jgi:hypothetical protein
MEEEKHGDGSMAVHLRQSAQSAANSFPLGVLHDLGGELSSFVIRASSFPRPVPNHQSLRIFFRGIFRKITTYDDFLWHLRKKLREKARTARHLREIAANTREKASLSGLQLLRATGIRFALFLSVVAVRPAVSPDL